MKSPSVFPLSAPVLHFRGTRDSRLHFSATVREGAQVRVEGRNVPLAFIGELAGARFFCADFSFDTGPKGRDASMEVDGTAFPFRLCGEGERLRIAYTSCNGGEDEDRARAFPTGRNAMWADLLATHERDPFHLLVMGGDQIYADAVWQEPTFRAWRAMGNARHLAPFTPAMRQEAEAFFLQRYGEVWREAEVAAALSRIPAVMMWDDHDISDGWGSYPDRERLSPVAQGLFAVARRAFALFQLGTDPDRPGEAFAAQNGAHFGRIADYGPARLVVPDLRSERTLVRVMDEGHALLAEGLRPSPGRHRLIVSSVPLVNVDLSRIERLLRRVGWHRYTDDLRDQWMSYAHRLEWLRVVRRLLDAARDGPVTVVSGEIHLAARGEARRGAARGGDARGGGRVVQLTASGIAHPPPPRAFGALLDRFVRRPWRREEIELEMLPLGRTGRRYLAERNWLEIAVAADLTATLHAEGSGEIDL